ncbi:MAG: dihydroneopterin aldolase [Clostridia bacterium]|nr:dihydroneopterin aldolase [Clostridia bacterium]
MDKITLNNMKFFGYHGVFPEEQANGQHFYIDVEMVIDLHQAGTSDALEDTVSYAEVFDKVKDITENKRFRLIEKLADSISREILSSYEKILEVTVRVRKPEAPMNGELDWVQIEIKRSRNE